MTLSPEYQLELNTFWDNIDMTPCRERLEKRLLDGQWTDMDDLFVIEITKAVDMGVAFGFQPNEWLVLGDQLAERGRHELWFQCVNDLNFKMPSTLHIPFQFSESKTIRALMTGWLHAVLPDKVKPVWNEDQQTLSTLSAFAGRWTFEDAKELLSAFATPEYVNNFESWYAVQVSLDMPIHSLKLYSSIDIYRCVSWMTDQDFTSKVVSYDVAFESNGL